VTVDTDIKPIILPELASGNSHSGATGAPLPDQEFDDPWAEKPPKSPCGSRLTYFPEDCRQ